MQDAGLGRRNDMAETGRNKHRAEEEAVLPCQGQVLDAMPGKQSHYGCYDKMGYCGPAKSQEKEVFSHEVEVLAIQS
jgi:hypothetical protein